MPAYSRFTSVCDNCHWRFRVDKGTLDEHRADLSADLGGTATDQDVAAVITICHRCCWGDDGIGEFIHENPSARRWDPKGWALDVLKRIGPSVFELSMLYGRLSEARVQQLSGRLSRCIFLATALRDRIDGRY